MRSSDLHNKSNDRSGFSLETVSDTLHVNAWGQWNLSEVARLDETFSALVNEKPYHSVVYNLDQVEDIDTAGAYILARAIRCDSGKCFNWHLKTKDSGRQVLLEAAEKAALGRLRPPQRPWYEMFARIGESVTRFCKELYDTLVFLGRFLVVLFGLLMRPHKIRWKSVVAMTEDVGLNALPIVMLLCFFIGAVIAYMGANLLACLLYTSPSPRD